MSAGTAAGTSPETSAETTSAPTEETTGAWQKVCALEDIAPNTGVCALLGGEQVALVRVGEGAEVYGLSNFDPFSKAFVLGRGIVGDRNGVPKIASPMYKQSFDLRSGQCLDDPAVRVTSYPVRVRDGWVEVETPAAELGDARDR
jgi:nitrite reductase (NADH) small subunit